MCGNGKEQRPQPWEPSGGSPPTGRAATRHATVRPRSPRESGSLTPFGQSAPARSPFLPNPTLQQIVENASESTIRGFRCQSLQDIGPDPPNYRHSREFMRIRPRQHLLVRLEFPGSAPKTTFLKNFSYGPSMSEVKHRKAARAWERPGRSAHSEKSGRRSPSFRQLTGSRRADREARPRRESASWE